MWMLPLYLHVNQKSNYDMMIINSVVKLRKLMHNNPNVDLVMRKLTSNNPKLDLVKVNAYAKFDQIPSICSQAIQRK